MNASVLVLNRSFAAIQVASWQRAISLLWQSHAEAVDNELRTYNFNDWVELSAMIKEHPAGFVHSPTLTIAIPEVIRLTRYDRLPKNEVIFTRRNILDHYKNICCFCGERFPIKQLTFDHLIPRSKGGGTNWENIVAACFSCNSRKANKTVKEAGMHMHYFPSKPKHQPVFRRLALALPIKTRESWQRFIDKSYWMTPLDMD